MIFLTKKGRAKTTIQFNNAVKSMYKVYDMDRNMLLWETVEKELEARNNILYFSIPGQYISNGIPVRIYYYRDDVEREAGKDITNNFVKAINI